MPEQAPRRRSHPLLSQPINRSLVIGFVLIALVPVGLLGIKVYQAAWDSAWREIDEKHRLLAMNLASPISIFIRDHRAMLDMLGGRLGREALAEPGAAAGILQRVRTQVPDFRRLALLDVHGRILAIDPAGETPDSLVFSTQEGLSRVREHLTWHLTPILPSPIDGQPSLIMTQPVLTPDGTLAAVVLGELGIGQIEQLRKNIKFGRMGHSAIVDARGRVIAHPNPDWALEMRDLSHIPIVQAMMAGRTGVTEFYSPFIQANMVAGYTAVPDIGWGVMVPQPKPEIEEQVQRLLFAQLGWGLAGLGLAVFIGLLLARWITGPINQLATAAQALTRNAFQGTLPPLPRHVPREVQQLAATMRELITGVQRSRDEVQHLNQTLQQRVDKATAQLRAANRQLEVLAHRDHLTGLGNRRSFEHRLMACRELQPAAPVCLLLIDIDHFKHINDRHGHAAGDAALVWLAGILRQAIRTEDLIARYGGDEFVVWMHCNEETGRRRARQILEHLRHDSFVHEGSDIQLGVSIGLFHGTDLALLDSDTFLRRVDNALYEAKRRGRNCLVEVGLSEG